MRTKIEELNLLYGLSVSFIMFQYNEFKTKSDKQVVRWANKINDLFLWIEKYDKVNSYNVVAVGEYLFEDKAIRKAIIDDEDVKDLVLEKLEQIDYDDLDDYLYSHDNLMVINYNYKDYIKIDIPTIEYLNNTLISSDYIYKDLIKLILDNFTFPKSLDRLRYKSHCINILNILNKIFYEVDCLLQSNREDLYYCVIWLLQSRYGKTLLFPNSFSPDGYDTSVLIKITRDIKSSVFNCLSNINKFYYIEVKDFTYLSCNKTCTDRSIDNYDFCDFIYNLLDSKQIISLFKIASYDKEHIYTEQDMKEIETLVNQLRTSDKIKITSQKTTNSYKDLIEKSFIYACEYCKNNNYEMKNLVYQPDFDINSSITFVEFYITYNKHDYKFKLTKYNNKFSWNVLLKDRKPYKIYLYLEDDFKHLIQAMIND